MSSPIDPSTPTMAADALTLFRAQADELHADLVRLRRELAEVHREVDGSRAMQLLETNQKLVLAALSAEAIAETAISNLNEVTRSSQLDPLTHTANRSLMFRRLASAMADARRQKTHIAVLFLDLDHFRYINNALGHTGGDEVLKLVARRLQSVLRDSDTVSRHGGDEFLILLTDISQPSDAAEVTRHILAAIAEPCTIGGVMLGLSASIGIAVYPGHGEDMDTLIDRADIAMYCSKRAGHGGFRFHSESPVVNEFHDRSSVLDMLPVFRESTERRFSDLREANEQLVKAALHAQELEAQAQEAHRQQIRFMAMVVHELRSPLTSLRAAASLALDRGSDKTLPIERLHSIIDERVTHMSRLVGDLLDGSRINTGKLRLEHSNIEMISIVQKAIELCQPAITAKKQQMSSSLLPGPIHFYGDEVRLIQVFSNLLDNASKYTMEDGQIMLTTTMLEHALIISVADTGIGISAETLPHIFDMFVQDAPALTHSNDGLGIGLAVVRDLVEAHGGTVTGFSAGKDLGSEFVVTLPGCTSG
jgi:diguanylate cyclase (GGDEF)-like protein